MALRIIDIEFKSLELEDLPILDAFFKKFPQPLDHYTFASLMIWKHEYHHHWAVVDDTLLIATQNQLMQPIGSFPQSLQKRLEAYTGKIFRVSDEFLAAHPKFCALFRDINKKEYANYIYRAEDLAHLAGRKYDSKRNLISQGESQYRYVVHPLTEKCKPHCPRILMDIGSKEEAEMTEKMKSELEALNFVLDHFSELQQKGFVISIDGKPAAFSIYEQLNPNTAVVHFEKAERKYKGLYQIINRETAKAIVADNLEFINREEDLGVEGLRKAKMSYYPIKLLNAHILEK